MKKSQFKLLNINSNWKKIRKKIIKKFFFSKNDRFKFLTSIFKILSAFGEKPLKNYIPHEKWKKRREMNLVRLLDTKSLGRGNKSDVIAAPTLIVGIIQIDVRQAKIYGFFVLFWHLRRAR